MADISAPSESAPDAGRPRLLTQVHEAIRRRYYSKRTEEAYVHWIKRYIYFSGKRHPAQLGEPEVTAFLNHLGAGSQSRCCHSEPGAFGAAVLVKGGAAQRAFVARGYPAADSGCPGVPAVLTRSEVERLLAQLEGTRWLIASLLYGSGLRVME